MQKLTGLIFLSCLFSSPAIAISNYYYNCPHKDVNKTRVVEMVFHSEFSTAPCEVVYHKPDKEPKRLWEAWNEEGYCEAKGEAFSKKLIGWGWMCEKVEGWYVPDEEQEVVEQGKKLTFAEALERRKIQLKIRGQQLEDEGLIKQKHKQQAAEKAVPSTSTAKTEPKVEPKPPAAEKAAEKTDWQKKMEELQKKKAEVLGDGDTAATSP